MRAVCENDAFFFQINNINGNKSVEINFFSSFPTFLVRVTSGGVITTKVSLFLLDICACSYKLFSGLFQSFSV